jgi:hypothetical protein
LSNTNIDSLKYVKYEQYKHKLDQLEKEYRQYVTDTETEESINKQFIPSKTALNGLNFVTKDEEKNLAMKESSDLHYVFKLIYIILKEEIPESNIIHNLVYNIVPKLGEKSLSK